MGSTHSRTELDSTFTVAWGEPARIAFRFCFLYLGLYCLTTKLSGGLLLLPDRGISSLGVLWPLRTFTLWFGEHVLGIAEPLEYTGNSWDTNFFWVQAFWVLLLALAATPLWSFLDRDRTSYAKLYMGFRVFLRLAIASQMFEYGTTKVIPVQFPSPSLTTLVTPVGSISMQGLFWTFVGASTLYQILTGVLEMLAGMFLLIERTAMLGALLTLATMLQVFGFNMFYDVGVKMISFHLVMMALFLLAPEFSRLANVFVRDRPAGRSPLPALFSSILANRVATAAQIVIGLYMVGVYTNITWIYWHQAGGGSPRSALYGIWNVDEVAVNGRVGPPSLNDYDRRWRRVIFDSPGRAVFQRTDDSFARYRADVDLGRNTLTLTKGESAIWNSQLAFVQPDEDRLILEGEMDGLRVRLVLERVPFDTFQLLNSHFRWVRPPDPQD